jgi:hypothetical protein
MAEHPTDVSGGGTLSPAITPTEAARRTIVEHGQFIDDRTLDARVEPYCRAGHQN